MTTEGQTRRRHFAMRSYQKSALQARQEGCKRFVEVLHRRAGKDRNWMSITFLAMLERKGVYFHVFPSLNQGRRDIWDNIIHETVDGEERAIKMTDMFPKEFVAGKNETEMQITLINGSIWQIMGADTKEAIDRMRGPNPVGLVFSEYAFMSHDPWEVLSPVLLENGGWVAFISTPNEEDDNFHKKYKFAQTEPWNPVLKQGWYASFKTVHDTRRDAEGENGEPVITQHDIDELIREGFRPETIAREYYCSFKGYTRGTIYGDLMNRAQMEGRIARFPYLNWLPVGILMDLGKADLIAVWYYQIIQERIQFIGYDEEELKGLDWWARRFREDKQYQYGRMVLPWDGWQAEMYFSAIGFRNIHVCDRTASVSASIDVVRRFFSRFYFDSFNCSKGIDHLLKYKKKFNEEKKVFENEPLHDVHSHGADSLRTGVEGGFEPLMFPNAPMGDVKIVTDFDPRLIGGNTMGPYSG